MSSIDRRAALVEVGARLFVQQGYGATSIDEICLGADVTKGGFFHYFPSKEAFAREVLDETWRSFVLAHEGRQDRPPIEVIHAHIDFMTAFIAGRGRLIPRLAQELGPSNPEIRHQVGGFFSAWTGFLVEALTRAGLTSGAESAMEFIVATIEGVPLVAGQLGDQVVGNATRHLKAYVDGLIPNG